MAKKHTLAVELEAARLDSIARKVINKFSKRTRHRRFRSLRFIQPASDLKFVTWKRQISLFHLLLCDCRVPVWQNIATRAYPRIVDRGHSHVPRGEVTVDERTSHRRVPVQQCSADVPRCVTFAIQARSKRDRKLDTQTDAQAYNLHYVCAYNVVSCLIGARSNCAHFHSDKQTAPCNQRQILPFCSYLFLFSREFIINFKVCHTWPRPWTPLTQARGDTRMSFLKRCEVLSSCISHDTVSSWP